MMFCLQHSKDLLNVWHTNREYTIWEARESNPACLNGDEHDLKNKMELPDHVNASKR